MTWFGTLWRALHRPTPAEEKRMVGPFPAASTFFGMAAALIVLWLLASGLHHFLGNQAEPMSRTNIEAGASK